MYAIPDAALIQLFEKLPVLPLAQVGKHFNASAIAVASSLSEKWKRIGKECLTKCQQETIIWEIIGTEDALKITIRFKDTTQNFQMQEPLDVARLGAFQHLFELFPPSSYSCIIVSLGSTSPDFTFQFLSLLPRGNAEYVKLQGDLEVNGADLVKFLENVKVKDGRNWFRKNRLDMHVRIKNVVTSDKLCFENKNFKIADGRFLTRESIPRIGFVRAEIGMNNFTSKDLNELLKWWMANERNRIAFEPFFIADLREDQNIKLQEVMEGLDAHVGKPRIRDRWRFDHPYIGDPDPFLYPRAIDMNEGVDIISSRGSLGSVLLEPNRFTFISWGDQVNWKLYEEVISRKIKEYTAGVSRAQKCLDFVMSSISERGDNWSAEDLTIMICCREKIEFEKYRLTKASEVHHMLMNEWNND